MTTRTFAAPTMQDAFKRVRDKLGASAVILDVRRLRGRVEVVAGRERPRRGTRRFLEQGARTARVELLEDDHPAAGLDMTPLRVLAGPGRMTPTLTRALSRLELPPDLAARLATIGGDGQEAWERLEAWLEQTHPVLVPIPDEETGILGVGFLGGRGTGRTTLVRGLAARAALQQPGRVVWVQVGFPARPATPIHEMLAPLGVDHRIANHPSEIGLISAEHGDVSAVLLDLPGIDLHHPGEAKALMRYVRAARAEWPHMSLHATVPATWSAREAVRSLQAQTELGVGAVAWTWLDRVADPGTVLAATLRSGLSPSFFGGDPTGNGDGSRSAEWDEVVSWLKTTVFPQGELK